MKYDRCGSARSSLLNRCEALVLCAGVCRARRCVRLVLKSERKTNRGLGLIRSCHTAKICKSELSYMDHTDLTCPLRPDANLRCKAVPKSPLRPNWCVVGPDTESHNDAYGRQPSASCTAASRPLYGFMYRRALEEA